MKKMFLVAAMMLVSLAAVYAQSRNGTVVKIKDERGKKSIVITIDPAALIEEEADCAKHKHHDVEVAIRSHKDMNRYEVTYYQSESDTVRRHKFSVGLDKEYQKAEYTWSQDTVSVSFFNKANKKSKIYRGYGRGISSSMIVD